MVSEFKFTKDEAFRIDRSLKDENFVKLLSDYAKELEDPVNRKRYEEELVQLEKENGKSCTFIHPKPCYVIKTKIFEPDCKDSKVFINICSDENIGKPESKAGTSDGKKGLAWSIPYSQSQPRQDIDKTGGECTVYDVIFHPDTAYLASKNPRMRNLVQMTAIDAVEKAHQVKLDRENLKFPKMQFKGIRRPLIIRQPLTAEGKTANVKSKSPVEESKEPPNSGKPVKPVYTIKHSSETDLQDHVYTKNSPSTRPKQLIIDIQLPLLSSSKGVDLDVQEEHLIVESKDYYLSVDLPYPVDEENGAAKFDKSKRTLAVTLPVKPAPQSKISEPLIANSETEKDENEYRTSPSKENESDIIEKHHEEKCEVKQETDDGYTRDAEECEDADEQYGSDDQDDFLEDKLSYAFPNYKCSVQNNVITFTLEVKNVMEDSLQKKILSGNDGVRLKFSSMGAGLAPLHHAFTVRFLETGSVEDSSVQLECWDNNVMVEIPLLEGMTKYQVGMSPQNLCNNTKHSLPELFVNKKEVEERKTPKKYEKEKYPKKIPTDQIEHEKHEKERHSSEESNDSVFSKSTDCTPQSDQSLQTSRHYFRSTSEEPDQGSSLKSILKRKPHNVRLGRFFSESHADDLTWSSSEKIFTVSQECMDALEEEGNSQKKSVRFNDMVKRQVYDTKSRIQGQTAKNKKKAAKKKRAAERRVSEGDADGTSYDEKLEIRESRASSVGYDTGDSLGEDSGCASSFEENVILTGNITPSIICNKKEKQDLPKKKKDKRRVKTFEMSSDLIFDLDI